MSAALQPSLELLQNQEVLGELLHSLSQLLTSLRCSLELSIDEVAEQQQATVSVALQQTEKVIGMIQLMREYLDAEQPGSEAHPVALTPAVRAVVEELSSIAALVGIKLILAGTCTASVPVPEPRLRLALQYLLSTLIEAARARALLRRSHLPSESVLTVRDLSLDRVQRKVERAGRHIELTTKEFALLEYLMRNAGRRLTRPMIIEHVWNMNFDSATNVVDVYINYLRRKVDDGFSPALIHTVRGVGYQINPEGASA